MATTNESVEDNKPHQSDYYHVEKVTAPWIDYAVKQTIIAQKTVQDTIESAISFTRSRLDQIKSTSSTHFQMTLDSLQDVKSEYNAYEDIVFGKIKEGILVAVSHPFITSGAVIGSGLLVMKRPRRGLYYNTLRLFVNEEAMLAKAECKLQNLRKSFDSLKEETVKLENISIHAEEEMKRGRTKLRQAGKQIQDGIRSSYKLERQAEGVKDILRELPSRDASKFRSQVSTLASEAKQDRKALTKVVSKISNYGISV